MLGRAAPGGHGTKVPSGRRQDQRLDLVAAVVLRFVEPVVGGIEDALRFIEGGADDDPVKMNVAEADSLYRLLELEVVPTFYDRDKSGVPKGWLRIVKEAIRTVMPHFSARRMMKQYAEEMYESAARRATDLN